MDIPASFGHKRPTLTVSKLKAYGAAGYSLEEGEDIAGCPRLYRARYIDHRFEAKQESPILFYGRTMHEALQLMEDESLAPEEALQRVWPEQLGPKEFQRAKEDLERYLERSEDASLSVLSTERTIITPLMEDPAVDFLGILDRIELDADDLTIVHVRDFKAGWSVPKRADVEGSIQGMAYSWLVWEAWESLGLPEEPSRVIFHLDSIRWRELTHEFTRYELDTFAEYARAIARRILADEEAAPILNPHCGYCPIKHDCKQWRRLPGRGPSVPEQMTAEPLGKLLAWQEEAKAQMKLLKAGVDSVDAILKARVGAEGGSVDVDGAVYYQAPRTETEWDLPAIYRDMGIEFIDEVAKITKTGLEAALRRRGDRLKGHALEARAEVVPAGTTIKKKAAE